MTTTRTFDRESVDGVLNEIDEYAIEEALLLRGEAHCGGTVTVLSMGPERATESVRKALQMGADSGVLVSDDGPAGGSCVVNTTSEVLAKALGGLEWDVVIAGSESTDARLGLLPALLAEQLGVPHTHRRSQGHGRRRHRFHGSSGFTDYGYDVVKGSLPALVSVTEKINEPRYPSFKGIMAAKKKPVDTVDLADLVLDADDGRPRDAHPCGRTRPASPTRGRNPRHGRRVTAASSSPST